jgi:hypothetical protein
VEAVHTLKRRSTSKRLHGAISKEAIILITGLFNDVYHGYGTNTTTKNNENKLNVE